jgi:hypothetical protein
MHAEGSPKVKAVVAVAWKTTTWLAFNLGAQALPIFYLYRHAEDDPKPLWEYVNCTLLLLIAVGILFAAISDLITERARVTLVGWAALLVIVVMAVAALQTVVHDEFLKATKADWDLFSSTAAICACVLGVGTFLKMKMWYNEAIEEG